MFVVSHEAKAKRRLISSCIPCPVPNGALHGFVLNCSRLFTVSLSARYHFCMVLPQC